MKEKKVELSLFFFQWENLRRVAVGILNCCLAARSTGLDFRAGEYTWWKFWWVFIEFLSQLFFFFFFFEDLCSDCYKMNMYIDLFCYRVETW